MSGDCDQGYATQIKHIVCVIEFYGKMVDLVICVFLYSWSSKAVTVENVEWYLSLDLCLC